VEKTWLTSTAEALKANSGINSGIDVSTTTTTLRTYIIEILMSVVVYWDQCLKHKHEETKAIDEALESPWDREETV
jgi:hypothetical protein